MHELYGTWQYLHIKGKVSLKKKTVMQLRFKGRYQFDRL